MGLIKLTDEQIRQSRPTTDELAEQPRFPIYAIIEDVRSMYNVGSMFRTSDAARIQELILCGYTACPPRKEIDKTALGATESVPWRHFESAPAAIESLRAEGVQVIALEHCNTTSNLLEVECQFPLAIVLGNEVTGITQKAINLVDMASEIPMYGAKQSLNVSVAYGIAVYQIIRKFLAKT